MTAGAGTPAGLRDRLRGGRPLLGSLLLLDDPTVVEVFALAGWDFVVLDVQHGMPDVRRVPDMIRAAEAAGTAVLARVSAARLADVVAWCDWGLAGFLVADVHSDAEAQAVVRAVSFPPEGRRSLHPLVRVAGYGRDAVGEVLRSQREAVAVWIMSEDGDLATAGRMADLDGVDCLFVGPYDLSLALGRPGEVASPEVRNAVRRTFETAHTRGKAAGIFARDAEVARAYVADGADIVVLGVDADLLRRHLADMRAALLQSSG